MSPIYDNEDISNIANVINDTSGITNDVDPVIVIVIATLMAISGAIYLLVISECVILPYHVEHWSYNWWCATAPAWALWIGSVIAVISTSQAKE